MARGGQNKHVPTNETRNTVSMLVAFGIPQVHIAAKLGISDETLSKHYREELDNGLHDANAEVANRLYAKAVYQDELQAQIFWLKTRGRWREREKEKDPEEKSRYDSLVEKLIDKLG